MIYPETEVRYINNIVGYGVFTNVDLPQGTIVYVEDLLEIKLALDDPRLQDPAYQPLIRKYSFIEPDGTRIISWDYAKHVNHSCEANSLSTSFGFEIAVRDIRAGEEITDDYGMFNLGYDLACQCDSPRCRKLVTRADFSTQVEGWDEHVRRSLLLIPRVHQPLEQFLSLEIREQLGKYLRGEIPYDSVRNLQWHNE